MPEPRKSIKATREITVVIHGVEYDALLIPKNAMIEIDYSQFPEDDPFRRRENAVRLTEMDLELGSDLQNVPDGTRTYRLTKEAAQRLLESL